MNTAAKVMLFSIMLNIATGIMINAMVDKDGNKIFNDPLVWGGLEYQSDYSDDLTGEMNKTINPTGDLEDKGDGLYRILDKLNLGIIAKIIKAISSNKYLFGFIEVLKIIIGPLLDVGTSNFVFGLFKIGLVISYIITAIFLWTGKDITAG